MIVKKALERVSQFIDDEACRCQVCTACIAKEAFPTIEAEIARLQRELELEKEGYNRCHGIGLKLQERVEKFEAELKRLREIESKYLGVEWEDKP